MAKNGFHLHSSAMSHPEAITSLPPVDFDRLLLKRRRFRSAKACYPCRRRKVKCDLAQPCASCLSRNHPDLCDYRTGLAGAVANVTSEEHPAEDTSTRSYVSESPHGLYMDPIPPFRTKVYVGPESLPSIVPASMTPETQSRPGRSAQRVFELLCLQDNSQTFPFTSLWSPGDDLSTVCSALPEDKVVRGVSLALQRRHYLLTAKVMLNSSSSRCSASCLP